MTPPLTAALGRLSDHLGVEDASADVRRVDVADGGGLVLEVGADGRPPRWFRDADGSLVELHPRDDGRLPLTADWDTLEEQGPLVCLGWKPGRRIALFHERPGAPVVLKGYRRGRSARARDAHLAADGDARAAGFRTPRLLHHAPDAELLAFEHVEGRALRVESEEVDTFFRAGSALRALQDASVALERTHDARAETDVVDRWAERVRRANGELPPGWQGARAALAAFPSAGQGPAVPAHRDLHDGQILVTARGPVFLDLDLAARCEPGLDAANLLAHLTLRHLQGAPGADEDGVVTCGAAFLDGLGRESDERFWSRLRFYQATTFLRLALVYALRPRWARLSPTLTRLALRCIEDGSPPA